MSPVRIMQRRWAQAEQYELRSHGNMSVVTSEQGGVAALQLLPNAKGLDTSTKTFQYGVSLNTLTKVKSPSSNKEKINLPAEPPIRRSFISLESKFPHRPHTRFCRRDGSKGQFEICNKKVLKVNKKCK